jgi:hypothetical protein
MDLLPVVIIKQIYKQILDECLTDLLDKTKRVNEILGFSGFTTTTETRQFLHFRHCTLRKRYTQPVWYWKSDGMWSFNHFSTWRGLENFFKYKVTVDNPKNLWDYVWGPFEFESSKYDALLKNENRDSMYTS